MLHIKVEFTLSLVTAVFEHLQCQQHSEDIHVQQQQLCASLPTMFGFLMCGKSLAARSLYAFIAISILSVPPDVREPTTSSSPCSIDAVIETTSFSKRLKYMYSSRRLTRCELSVVLMAATRATFRSYACSRDFKQHVVQLQSPMR